MLEERMPLAAIIYSLGSSNRLLEDFLDLLASVTIKIVLDVRRFPTSGFSHFVGTNLERLLKAEGYSNHYLGDLLGGFRKPGYEEYTLTHEFQAGLVRLERLARSGQAAFICAKRFPWRCHRRFIARRLEEKGWQVIHIIDKDRVWKPRGP